MSKIQLIGAKYVAFLALCIFGLLVTEVYAQDSSTLSVYRDSEGAKHEYPEGSERIMKRIARNDGHITLWLTLNYPFDFYFDDMTDEQINEQQEEVEGRFAEILEPLIAAGNVWEPPSGSFVRGPGCTVRANKRGLRKLIRDVRLLQVVHSGESVE